MEFSQEQLDVMILEKITEAKKGLFTEDDVNRKVVSEVDRRVESGIQKGLETQKQKWEVELAQKANLTAEEIAKKKFEQQLNLVTGRESEVSRRANQLEAKELLTDAGIPKSQYEKVITMLVSDNEEVTKANVQSFINMFTETKTELENKIKSELANVPPPKSGNGDKVVSKVDFNKMPYGEKMNFKISNPDLYKEFIK